MKHAKKSHPEVRKQVALPPHANAEAHARVMQHIKKMTPDEFVQSLVHAGILTRKGKLAPQYR